MALEAARSSKRGYIPTRVHGVTSKTNYQLHSKTVPKSSAVNGSWLMSCDGREEMKCCLRGTSTEDLLRAHTSNGTSSYINLRAVAILLGPFLLV